MFIRTLVKYITSCLLLILIAQNRTGAQAVIGTDKIESLIDEWNFANNTRNIHSFEKVYDNQLLFYNERVSRAQAIRLKQQEFRTKPWFRQRITTEINYAPHSAGVVKCKFTMELFEKTYWKKYPSYLLVSYANNRYSIVGEGFDSSGKALLQKQETGNPVAPENEVQPMDTVDSSTALAAPALLVTEHPDSVDDDLAFADPDAMDIRSGSGDIDAVFSGLSSMGMITVPRGYVFILIGMLGLGGLLIFLADSVQSRKRRRVKVVDPHAEAEYVVRDFRIQAAFEAFVITLFDPLYFQCTRPKAAQVYAGKSVEPEKGPDLVLDYHQKETHVRFAITCQYYHHAAKNEVQLLSRERQESIRHFEDEGEMDVYYVLGFGGRPDDPRELFFVPAGEVRREYMTRRQLEQYSKSGMFYYNRRTGRIQ